MTALVLALIVKLVTFFLAKKSGASTTEAALLGLTAGGLTYAALSASDFDKTNVKSLSNDKAIKYNDMTELVNSGVSLDGSTAEAGTGDVAYIAQGSDGLYYRVFNDGTIEQVQQKTSVSYDAAGNETKTTTWETATKEVGETLRSWGPLGTSAVLATTKAVTSSSSQTTKWVLIAAAACAAILIFK